MKRFSRLILSSLFFILCNNCLGQSYGLGFIGHEEDQDKRTAFDLSAGKQLCLEKDFELSFDLSFIPGHSDYFGYIFRVIDDDGRNIDLVYDKRFLENKHFKLIIGDEVSNIAFNISLESLFKRWHQIKLVFDRSKTELFLKVDENNYSQKVKFTPAKCVKILFGANNYKEFRITDLPSMKVKNIRIIENKTLVHHWPLTEQEGGLAKDVIGDLDAKVTNPLWIKKMHYQWELLQKVSIKGAASVAFDKKTENLHIVGSDSIFVYSVPLRKFSYVPYQTKQFLMPGNQSFFDSVNNRLLNLYIDQKLISKFDFPTTTWDKQYKQPDVITNFWHYNKFYSSLDSSIYMIGGYGQFTYYKDVLRYHFPTQKWEVIKAAGDFTPRYLAALGSVKGGAYVLGGYGSSTGQQILNPKNLYDLSFYDVKRQTFKKLFELENHGKEFAFANSMVINENERSYYALAFNNQKFRSALQLIHGSLDSGTYQATGAEIPYTFHDIHSFADLYYSAQTEKFVAVTLFHDVKTDETRVEIYSLLSPPIVAEETLGVKSFSNKLYMFGVVSIVILLALWIFYKKLKQRRAVNDITSTASQPESDLPLALQAAKEVPSKEKTHTEKPGVKNSIFLFGDMQVFDNSGNDITKYFTPLVKELFLVITLYTLRGDRGISAEKLTEVLWFDKSVESARNNRSVNIAKLKAILDKLDGCQVSKETGYWKIRFDPDKVWIDYTQYLRIVADKQELSKEKIIELAEITQRGSFLSNAEYNWLDAFKSEVANKIIDTYLHFAATIKIANDPEFLISLANYVFYFDPVNEDAMTIKCKALVYLGKHSLAKNAFDVFNKEYKAIYGEEFSLTFQEVLE